MHAGEVLCVFLVNICVYSCTCMHNNMHPLKSPDCEVWFNVIYLFIFPYQRQLPVSLIPDKEINEIVRLEEGMSRQLNE